MIGSWITVRKHAGRSGKSVYCWRVYREWSSAPGRKAGQTQLLKARTQEIAEKAAKHYRDRDSELAASALTRAAA